MTPSALTVFNKSRALYVLVRVELPAFAIIRYSKQRQFAHAMRNHLCPTASSNKKLHFERGIFSFPATNWVKEMMIKMKKRQTPT